MGFTDRFILGVALVLTTSVLANSSSLWRHSREAPSEFQDIKSSNNSLENINSTLIKNNEIAPQTERISKVNEDTSQYDSKVNSTKNEIKAAVTENIIRRGRINPTNKPKTEETTIRQTFNKKVDARASRGNKKFNSAESSETATVPVINTHKLSRGTTRRFNSAESIESTTLPYNNNNKVNRGTSRSYSSEEVSEISTVPYENIKLNRATNRRPETTTTPYTTNNKLFKSTNRRIDNADYIEFATVPAYNFDSKLSRGTNRRFSKAESRETTTVLYNNDIKSNRYTTNKPSSTRFRETSTVSYSDDSKETQNSRRYYSDVETTTKFANFPSDKKILLKYDQEESIEKSNKDRPKLVNASNKQLTNSKLIKDSDRVKETHDSVISESQPEAKETVQRNDGARSLDINIDKYVSSEFHNKNNVYNLPLSPETQKYVNSDYFTEVEDHSTYQTAPIEYTSNYTKFETELTTPASQYFDHKFRQVEDGVKQNLEYIDHHFEAPNYKDEKQEEFNIDKAIEESRKNEARVDLEAVKYQNLTSDGNKNRNSFHKDFDTEKASNVVFESSYNKTILIDEPPKDYKNKIPKYDDVEHAPDAVSDDSEVKYVKKLGKVTEKPLEIEHTDTTNKSTTKPTKAPPLNITDAPATHLSNKIEPEILKPVEIVEATRATTPPPTTVHPLTAPVEHVYLTNTKDNAIYVSKRGSTKFENTKVTTLSEDNVKNERRNFTTRPTTSTSSNLRDNNISRRSQQNRTRLQPVQENQINSTQFSPSQKDLKDKTIINDTTEKRTISSEEIDDNVSPFPTVNKATVLEFNKGNEFSSKSTPEVIRGTSKFSTTTKTPISTEAFATSISSVSVKLPLSTSNTARPFSFTATTLALELTTLKTTTELESTPTMLDTSTATFSTFTTELPSASSDSYSLPSIENLDSSQDDSSVSNYTSESGENAGNKINFPITKEINNNSTEASENEEALNNSQEDLNSSFNESEGSLSNSTEASDDKITSSKPGFVTTVGTNVFTDRDSFFPSSESDSSEDASIAGNSTDTVIISLGDNNNTLVNNNKTQNEITLNVTTEDTIDEFVKDNSTVDTDLDEDDITDDGGEYVDVAHKVVTPVASTKPSTSNVDILHIQNVDKEHSTLTSEIFKPDHRYPKPVTFKVDTVSETIPPSSVSDNPSNSETSESETTDITTAENLDSGEKEGNGGTIAAITISCIGAVCLILLAGLLFVMRKRHKRFNYGQRCTPVSLDAYSVDNVSVYNSMRRKAMRASKRSYGNPAFEDPTSVTHPLDFSSLAKFANNLEGINAEYDEIPQVTAQTNELPEGCENKNRYANVIPLPESRVFLSLLNGVPNSDYINANYVAGPKNIRGYYIACQAPLQNTVDDFWRMIWEQQSKIILMLTHLFENGIEKCTDYLPPSEVLDCHRLFGDFQVTLKKQEVKEKYVISSLQLKNMVSNSWREVTHLWYMGWPEKGVPSEANSLIAFLIEARSYIKSASTSENTKTKETTNGNISNGPGKSDVSPVVVHCSPGTGRTGTIIACDIAIREFELSRQVDIPRTVYRIRRDRASSVQTKNQYAFIYKVISLYATKLTGGVLDSL